MRTMVLSVLVLALAIPLFAAPPKSKPKSGAPRAQSSKAKRDAETSSPADAKPDAETAAPQVSRQAGPGAAAAVGFVNDVMPLLDCCGCNTTPCHGSAKGKGELKLSMFGADPEHDYLALTKAAGGRRINRVEPLKSLLLLKATGAIEHGGKQPIRPDSPEYRTLAAWLVADTPQDDPNGRKIMSVSVAPAVATVAEDQTQQLSVTAVFSDGTRQDVTGTARYESSDKAVATVNKDGLVQAAGFGQSHVLVSYRRRSAVSRVAVPQPLAAGFPQAQSNHRIDELVLARLRELGIPPSELCSDQEFLRRISLDVIGTLPTPQEIGAFVADADAQKRAKLIDRLLERREFADFWALKWGDLLRIKAEYPSNLWPNAVQAYHHWIWDSIVQNKPYDQFVRELLVSTGCNFRDPPVNYYRALEKRDPQGFAESTALVFMGARIDCARCHAHPTESWTLEDNLGMAAFFTQIKFKSTKEWKEEIVFLDLARTLLHPKTRQEVSPKLLGGQTVQIPAGEDRRIKLAEWLTSPENPWFARNIVNRIWFWLLGRGIVHEPDDTRPTNPPCNAELLAYLEKELIEHKFDLRHMYRLILNSATYQRSSKPNRFNAQDVALFSHYQLKRLTAEQLSDAIGQLTLVWDAFSSQIPEPYSRWPSGFRATQMADGSVGTPFLELFGRPTRDTAYESDRDCRTSMRQALFLITSADLQQKVSRSPRLKDWLKDTKNDAAIVEQIFLLSLSRPPTPEERQQAVQHLAKDPKARNQALQDLLWALVNTKEFLFNH